MTPPSLAQSPETPLSAEGLRWPPAHTLLHTGGSQRRPQMTRVGTRMGRQEPGNVSPVLLWILVTHLPNEVLPACTPLCISISAHWLLVVSSTFQVLSSYMSLKCQQPANKSLAYNLSPDSTFSAIYLVTEAHSPSSLIPTLQAFSEDGTF